MKERKNKMKKGQFRQYIPLYIMLIPGLAYLIINNYIPMAGIVIAFQKYDVRKGMFGGDFVGLANFAYLFKSDAFTIIRNTLLYNIAFIIINLLFGVVIAIMICDVKSGFGKKIYQSSILLPFLISMVIVSYIVYALLSPERGMINKSILEPMGKDMVNWYSQPKYWPFILILVNTWKGVGYGCLLYIAAINGIDRNLYEAAALDGAGKWKQIKYITIPCIVPTIVTLLLLNVGRIFYSDFGLFYQVTQNSGALYNVTQTIDTYVYRAMISAGGIGRSSAAGVFQSIVGFTLVVTVNQIVRKISPDNAIF